MKFKIKKMNFLKFITVFFFASVLFTSCVYEPVDSNSLPSNGTGTGGGTTSDYYLKVTKDGVVKQYSIVQGLNFTALNTYAIIASDPINLTSMTLNLHDISKIGVYNLSWAVVSCGYTEGTSIYTSDYSDFNTSPGNITLTEINTTNKTIKGTFNFSGKNDNLTSTKVFTKGEFFTSYIVQ